MDMKINQSQILYRDDMFMAARCQRQVRILKKNGKVPQCLSWLNI